jgi:outer membrane protein OmpA-like peptidoglycan-associated protein
MYFVGMVLAQALAEDSMREPTPEIMRGVSARLSGHQAPDRGACLFRGIEGQDAGLSGGNADGQHFDIFSREHRLRPASWVICWSDLMMTMFIMFAALYIFQIPKIQFKSVSEVAVNPLPLGTAVLPPRPSDGSVLDRLHDRVRDLVARDGLEAVVSVQSVPGKSLHVTIAGDLLFHGSTAALRGDVKKILVSVGEILRSAPHTLSVVGHSASGEAAPGYRSPWEFSAAMAAAVAASLMEDAGLPATRVLVAGYGDQRPLTQEGVGGANRRVELILSTENPTEPLPLVRGPAKDGFREWLAASQQEGR